MLGNKAWQGQSTVSGCQKHWQPRASLKERFKASGPGVVVGCYRRIFVMRASNMVTTTNVGHSVGRERPHWQRHHRLAGQVVQDRVTYENVNAA